jgi:hypothetical protein
VKRQIKIYNSFEEQQRDEIAYSLSLTPEQRIAEAVRLIKKVYGYKYDPTRKRQIKIISHE